MDASVVIKSERGRKKEKIYKEGNRDCQEGKVKTCQDYLNPTFICV